MTGATENKTFSVRQTWGALAFQAALLLVYISVLALVALYATNPMTKVIPWIMIVGVVFFWATSIVPAWFDGRTFVSLPSLMFLAPANVTAE